MIVLPVAFATLLLHLATASRYGYFRDELYFIACSKHLAWGYVDQPPLVAVAALLSAPFDYRLALLRLLPAIAAALATIVAAQIAKDLGGGRFSQVFAAVAVALTPAYLLLGNVLTTTSFEALSWMLTAWCAIRLVRGGASTWWIALALCVAFGLLGKYSMALLAFALYIGLLFTRERRVLATAWFPASITIAAVLLAPNIAWQWAHGFPFLQVLQGDAANRHAFNSGLVLESRRFFPNAAAFATEQALYTNPAAVPIWIAALVVPFTWSRMRDLRFISLAYCALFVLAIGLDAKGYYVIGIYGVLFAIGAVALERATRAIRYGASGILVAVAIATMPLSIPVLPLHGFIGYTELLGLTSSKTPHLMQPVYAEEFGWDKLARDVAHVYDTLDPATRARTAIYADTYADAGAIDLFGAQYGLPAAIGSQNTYWVWGPRNYDGKTLVAVGASRIDILKRYYRSVTLVSTSVEPMKWIVEGPAPIYLCSHPVAPLRDIWEKLRWYGA